MIDSITNLSFFRKNFLIAFLRKYKIRSLGRALVYKLDFELFVTAQSSKLLKEKWELDLSSKYSKYYQLNKNPFLNYSDNLINFKAIFNKLKIKKTILLDNFEHLNEDDLNVRNYPIKDDNLLNNLSAFSKTEVDSKFDRIYQVRHTNLEQNSRGLNNCNFRPALYDEPIFLEKMLRFKKRPDIKKRRLRIIDRYNYHLIIKFLFFNLRKKLKLMEKNIKIFFRFFNKFYYLKFICMFKIYKKNCQFLKEKFKQLKKISKLIYDYQYHKLILLEYRKLNMAFFTFNNFLNSRFFIFNKFFVFLRNDLNFYLLNLKNLYKRSRKFALHINDLMRIYHVGLQYLFKKIKQFFLDFRIVVKVIIRDFFFINNLFWRFLSFLKKICKFFLNTTKLINVSYFYPNYYSYLSFVLLSFVNLLYFLKKNY